MTDFYDAIVVGAGHNGLVCSAILAKAGKNVLVLEANQQVGGAAVTREFADGYSVSACAHLLYQLQPEIRRELGISPQMATEHMSTIVLAADGKHLRLQGDKALGVAEEDAAQYSDFRKRMKRFAKLLRKYLNKPPPRLGTKDWQDLGTLAQLGIDIRMLGKEEMRRETQLNK